MGARILSALDAAMAAHAEEQPAAGWDNEPDCCINCGMLL